MDKKTNLGAVASVSSMNGSLNAIKYEVLGGRPTRLAGGLTLNKYNGTASVTKRSSKSGL